MGNLVSEDDLARARTDPTFRHHLLAEQLDQLLEALNRMRRSSNNSPESARLIREGVDLAVKLADRLHRGGLPPRAA
jgi:DNA-binding transcriptional LysR family regulator